MRAATAMAAARHGDRREPARGAGRVAYRPGPVAILLFKSAGSRLDSTLELLGPAAVNS
ncbi:hypothetical protein [Amycolatopsis minnesotensis]|uniref:hypothetical protein n=1 Tax=Amycolatopsis minnesotensis TaxID=337894 RepID=UPI0031D11F5B